MEKKEEEEDEPNNRGTNQQKWAYYSAVYVLFFSPQIGPSNSITVFLKYT